MILASTKMRHLKDKYGVMLLSGIISAFVCWNILVFKFSRDYAVYALKNQFDSLEESLQSMGYDFAYDDLRFYSWSPWQIMRAKNFKIYTLDEDDFWQWNIDELSIDVGLFNSNKVSVFMGTKQEVQKGSQLWQVTTPETDVSVKLKKGNLKTVDFELANIDVHNLFKIDSVRLSLKRQYQPFMSGILDIRGIVFDDMTGWALNKHIDHFYLDFYTNGWWDNGAVLNEAVYDWIDKGGDIEVKKAILNWKPLIMVANGNVTFNEQLEPTVSLNTASLALLETLDKLNENGYLSNKGVFVTKILLSNKAVQRTSSDKYKTVVSPLKISGKEVTLENIRIK